MLSPSGLHKALPSTNSYYTACTKYFPDYFVLPKLARKTPQHYFVLHSLHKVLHSTNSYDTAYTKYFPALLRTAKACMKDSPALCTTKLLDTEAFTQIFFCTKKLLHKEAFARRSFTHRTAFTQRNFCTHTQALHTEKLLHSKALFQTEAFRPISFVTEKLSHRVFYTRNFYTEKLLHTEACAHGSFTHKDRFYT